jgi:HSP20 family protein
MLHLKSRPETNLSDSFFPQSFNSVIGALMDERRSIVNDFTPSADILEMDTAFEIRMALPGIKKEEVKISLEGDLLRVEGERKQESETSNSRFIKKEMSFGRFSRSFKIGKIELSKIEAAFEHGILKITLPKSAEEKPAQILIK